MSSDAPPASLDTITLPRPLDDLHLHVRDGSVLPDVLGPMLRTGSVARAIIMPNLQPPVTNVDMARDYRDRILSAVDQAGASAREQAAGAGEAPPHQHAFTPLMTLYLTDHTTQQEIRDAKSGTGEEAEGTCTSHTGAGCSRLHVPPLRCVPPSERAASCTPASSTPKAPRPTRCDTSRDEIGERRMQARQLTDSLRALSLSWVVLVVRAKA